MKKESTSRPQRALYLTMDTDWCTAEVLEFSLSRFRQHRLPCTVFATGDYAALRHAETQTLEVALHPNFNEVTAARYAEKLNSLQQLYPNALGVSSHTLTSSTLLLQLFKQSGLRYDRNLLRYKEAGAQPFLYYNGLLRLPIFWEDDIWFGVEPGARFSAELLERERFHLIFNFHPIHLFMNTASLEHYQAFKHQPRMLAQPRRTDYGALSFFEDLVAYIHTKNIAAGLLRDFLQP